MTAWRVKAAALLDHPLALPLSVGAVLRVVAALVGYGFFASDDYRYAIEPAWRWLDEPELGPPSAIRSVLLARVVWMVFSGARALGIEDPAHLVRSAYLVLGVYSLLAIPAVYQLTRARLGEPAARAAAWLMAAEALLPRISTRALIEVASIPPLVWSLVFAERAFTHGGARSGFASGLLVACAAMFRFQLGVVSGAVAVLLVWRVLHAAPTEARPARRALAGFALGGLTGALAQGLLDLATHGEFFASPLRYLAFNVERSHQFGAAPWFTYLVMLLLVTLPPATFWLARPLWRAARAHLVVSVPLALFVLVHSLVEHKEERFLFPALPLVFVVLGAALVEAWRAGGWPKRAAGYFWVMNGVALLVATLSDGQRSVIDPLLEVGRGAPFSSVVSVGRFEVPRFYAAGRATVERHANVDALEAAWTPAPPRGRLRIITHPDPPPLLSAALSRHGLDCEPPRVYRGDLVDRLLLVVNPAGNRRRASKTVIDCAAPGRD